MTRCLFCYNTITDLEQIPNEFHYRCSMKIFGSRIPPKIDYNQSDMLEIAEKVVRSQKTVTGVQPKLSLGRKRMNENLGVGRFTILGLWQQYILKPQTKLYSELPEIEDLTMHLAESVKIRTIPIH